MLKRTETCELRKARSHATMALSLEMQAHSMAQRVDTFTFLPTSLVTHDYAASIRCRFCSSSISDFSQIIHKTRFALHPTRSIRTSNNQLRSRTVESQCWLEPSFVARNETRLDSPELESPLQRHSKLVNSTAATSSWTSGLVWPILF